MIRHGLMVILGGVVSLFAQAPDTLWTKTYGGLETDYGVCVELTSDGDYAILGMTRSFGAGSYDVWLIKTDSLGDTLWTRMYGESESDYGYAVQQTSDDGYIIVGATWSYGSGLGDVWLIKTDSLGNILWSKIFGGSDTDYGKSVCQTTDGGYIIAGFTLSFGTGYYDVWLIKTDANGDTLWTRTYGGTNLDVGEIVRETSDGGYIIGAHTNSFGPTQDIWLIKTDKGGDTLWTKIYNLPQSEAISSVQQTMDGGYIIAGQTYVFPTVQPDGLLIKTDPSGEVSWIKTYDYDLGDAFNSVQQTTDGGYIIAGFTGGSNSPGDSAKPDVWIIKTDSLGDTLWTRTYGRRTGDEVATSVRQTSDERYIVVGHTNSFGSGDNDIWLIRLGSETEVSEYCRNNTKIFPVFRIYPNPFTNSILVEYQLNRSTNVEITIYNSLGQKIITLVNRNESTGFHRVIWDGHDHQGKKLAGGVYFCRFRVGDYTTIKRVCLVR